ncbi:MAG: hypothetical protein ACW96U_08025 [Candidatus Heimdallarchaeaceae archaeon]|jgi:uncharacterized protein YeeX (DUF496 family)
MTDLEDRIEDYVLEEGLSSKARALIKENIPYLSSEFLTDILVENVNLHISYLFLIEYLPYIWKEDNSSKNLLNYLSGLAHRLFYLAREYPLGKAIPKNQKEELENIHSQLCDFMKSCLNEDLNLPQFTVTNTKSFTELLDNLIKYPKYPHKIFEIFQILASLFYHFALNEKQILRNQDELGIYISRCLVFWKLGVLDNEKMIICFEKAAEKYEKIIQPDKFENILALELQSYQFLQLGINKKQVELITDVFCKLRC